MNKNNLPEEVSHCSHSIAPAKVVRGERAWEESHQLIASICRSPLLLGRSIATAELRQGLLNNLKNLGLNTVSAELKHDCCEMDLKRINALALCNSCDGVIAAGGGKVLDAGKLLAHRLGIPCITVPLSAATCAGWTALANIYSPTGAFQRDQVLARCPHLMIFDHGLVRQAPPRTLASGIADAIAKWYEASVSNGSSNDGLIQQAVQMARVLRDQLLLDGPEALKDQNSLAWIRVAEACALTAGLIGGIGGSRCRTAAAHAVHNALTQLKDCHEVLHGEKVGYGILVQLRLEEIIGGHQLAGQARRQLIPFLKGLDLPVNLEDLGLSNLSLHELHEVCQFACQKGSHLYQLPFPVNSSALLEALLGASDNGPVPVESTVTKRMAAS